MNVDLVQEGADAHGVYNEDDDDADSLFDDTDNGADVAMDSEMCSRPASPLPPGWNPTPALRRVITSSPVSSSAERHSVDLPGGSVPGLHFDADVRIGEDVALRMLEAIDRAQYFGNGVNQVMLFGRVDSDNPSSEKTTGLPLFIHELVQHLSEVLLPVLHPSTYELLFPLPHSASVQARQAILNLYHPGEGISPHVDLLGRYGDGIIGVTFCAGTVMDFRRVRDSKRVEHEVMNDESQSTSDAETLNRRSNAGTAAKRHYPQLEKLSLWLPERSVIVLEGDARYGWTHGIDRRNFDYVQREFPREMLDGKGEDAEAEWIRRQKRISITLRWLLSGADIVGS